MIRAKWEPLAVIVYPPAFTQSSYKNLMAYAISMEHKRRVQMNYEHSACGHIEGQKNAEEDTKKHGRSN